jgi:L-asparagine transporter-like permease
MFCSSCSTALEPGAKFCAACGTPVVVTPAAGPAWTAPPPASPAAAHIPGPGLAPLHARRYPALRIVAVILKVVAVLCVAVTLIGFIAALVNTTSNATPFGASLGYAVLPSAFLGIFAGFGAGLYMWATAEMIGLAIDIEDNTRRAIPRT